MLYLHVVRYLKDKHFSLCVHNIPRHFPAIYTQILLYPNPINTENLCGPTFRYTDFNDHFYVFITPIVLSLCTRQSRNSLI